MRVFYLFFPVFLFAMIDFSPCYQKYKFITSSIPITSTKSVTFIKPKKYLYYDPFTHIYVFSHANKKTVNFFDDYKLGWFMASIKKNSVYGGTFAKRGFFLNFSTLSVPIANNSIITDVFCRACGVGSKRGFIDGKKIIHFVKYGYWGDIGIGVNEELKVIYSDPFYTDIRPEEKILYINSKKATPKIFTKYILLNEIGKKVEVITNKGKYILTIRKLKYNFTPLMHFGIKLDKSLNVYLPKKLANKFFLKSGKLIEINGKKVKSFKEALYLLSFYKNVTITIKKDGIILKVNLKDMDGRIY